MIFFKIIFLILIFSKFYCTDSQFKIEFDESKELIWIKNFKNFSAINLKNQLINEIKHVDKMIIFIPTNKISFIDDYFLIANGQNFDLRISFSFLFSKIKSFGSKKSVFKTKFEDDNPIFLKFFHSDFFYSVECNDYQVDGIFKHVKEISFAFTVRYFPNVCPLIFKNTNLYKMEFYGISKNFLSTNHLDFDQKLDLKLINSTIQILYLNFYKGIITQKMMIFKNTSNLKINGMIDKIEKDSFSHMKIKFITLLIDNEAEFFSQGFDWTSTLNFDLRVNFTDVNNLKMYSEKVILITTFSRKYNPQKINYPFPDHDFCLFKNFPDDRLVFIELKILNDNFTCLHIWLLKKKCIFNLLLNISDYKWLCKNMSFLREKITKCNFDKRLQNCKKIILKFSKISMDWILYYSEIADFFFVIVSYLLVLIAFFGNIISCFILSNLLFNYQFVKDTKNSIEVLMLSNCIINLIYLVIRTIHLSNKCVYPHSIFCADFHKSIQSQYLEIIAVDLFGNLCKFTSNLLQIMVSAKRLMLLDPQFKNRMHLFLNLKVFKISFISFVSIYVVIIIAAQIITTKINNMPFQLNHLENYFEYPNKKLFFANYLNPIAPLSITTNSVPALIIFILNISINNVLSICLFCIAEILFFIDAKSNIKRKKNLNLNFKSKGYKKSPTNKSLNVILINLIFLIFFRILTILTSIFIIYQKSINNYSHFNICSTHHKVCTIFQEIDEILFTLTISFLIVFYFYAYKQFKKNLLNSKIWTALKFHLN